MHTFPPGCFAGFVTDASNDEVVLELLKATFRRMSQPELVT